MDVFNRQEKGQQAELLAYHFLKAKGLELIEKNYSCHFGEIDLIMREGEEIVFVEVRSRSRTDYGRAAESVNQSKKMKLVKTATHFLQGRRWIDKVYSRFDVVGVHVVKGDVEMEWFRNAFWLGG